MIKTIRNLSKNIDGASAAEYALIVAILGGLVAAGATAFGGSLNSSMSDAGVAIAGRTTSAATVINP